MSDTAIKVEGLAKLYQIGTSKSSSLRESLMQKVGWLKGGNKKRTSEFWALQDVSFEINRGEAVGIIGKNGAGKSTLLKILSRITQPTKGRIEISGRVASLLEVGTGFHPELSGRENVYLNGTILGMTRKEIKSKFDEIVDFSGVEKFIDTPVKFYSSGMYVRLAFAVAAHLEPEILIIDEVLAVGDAEFQKKCLGKMGEVAKQGRTVLFVSHNITLVKSLCNKGILLNKGKVSFIGSANEAINIYNDSSSTKVNSIWINETADLNNKIAFIEKVEIVDNKFNHCNEFINSKDVFLQFTLFVQQPHFLLKLGFDLIRSDEIVFRSSQVDSIAINDFKPNSYYTLICKLPAFLLHKGIYSIRPLLSLHGIESLTCIDTTVLSFHINLDSSKSVFHAVLDEKNHPGVIYPFLQWNLLNDHENKSLAISSIKDLP